MRATAELQVIPLGAGVSVRTEVTRIVGLLGEGGMGAVWEAEQDRPHRRVALKVMRREHQVDDLHARLFQREAETLARLLVMRLETIYVSQG